MKNNFKILNAWICQIKDQKVKPVFGNLHVSDGKIIKVEKKKFSSFLQTDKEKSAHDFNAGGRVITIPQVNFHEHIYSRLAKGLNITGATDNFENILSNLWWKLDNLLDKKMIEASAKMAAIESIKNGVTYLFDHHSSPNYAKGSLSIIANVLQDFNLRGVLCFETTDRNGKILSEKGIQENVEFSGQISDNVKSMYGIHASFTVDEETLIKASKLVKMNNHGIHIHLSEDEADNKISKAKYDLSPIDRLIKYNLLNDKSILAHAVNISKADWTKIKKYNAAVVINSESNMNNSVGVNQFASIPNEVTLLCGTDGMHANPARTLKTIYLLMRQQGISFESTFAKINQIYFDQIEFAKKYFPDFSSLNVGEKADFIIWDYVPPTPITAANFWSHYIYGIIDRSVSSVFQNGKILMREHRLAANEKKINKDIFNQGKKLFYKFNH